MFDQASRSMWLAEQLWPRLRTEFNLTSLPEQVLITVGYPSSGARGRSDKIRPAEINHQWQGNECEKAFISIHPVYFDSPMNIAKAVTFQALKVTRGARWGASKQGLEKEDNGTITASAECQKRLERVLADVGEPPSGYGVAFPVRTVQRTRLRKYVADTKVCGNTGESHPVIRAASDTLTVTCACGAGYKAV